MGSEVPDANPVSTEQTDQIVDRALSRFAGRHPEVRTAMHDYLTEKWAL